MQPKEQRGEVSEAAGENAAAESEEETDGDLEAEGLKVVNATTLANVAGYVYNPETKVLSWNKVAGASDYKYEISYVDETGAEETAKTSSVTALSGVAFKELDNGYAIFTVTSAAKLKDGEYVEYSYANNAAFQNDEGSLQFAVEDRRIYNKRSGRL